MEEPVTVAREVLVVKADMKRPNSMMTECNARIAVANLLSLLVKDTCLIVNSL